MKSTLQHVSMPRSGRLGRREGVGFSVTASRGVCNLLSSADELTVIFSGSPILTAKMEPGRRIESLVCAVEYMAAP